MKTIARENGARLVVELLRPHRDARIAFEVSPARGSSRRPAFVIVRRDELDAVIDALVAVRDQAPRGAR